jgi:KDO2-lipid IV(A) lauroyltransferase
MGRAEHPRGQRPRLKHRVEHLFFRGVLRSLSRQATGPALERGARLGRLWHALDRPHRRLAEESIGARLGLPPAAAARTALACFENLGRNLAEFAIAGTRVEELLAGFGVEGLEHLRAALDRGRGVFFLSGHCGNWELFGARLAREVRLTSVARAMSNPLVDAGVAAQRQAAGSRTVDALNATREILRTLGRNEAVGVLLDQNALRRERVFVNFLGRPAATNFGLAMLALKSGSPVLPAFSVREGVGRHRGWIGPPIQPCEGGERAERVGRSTARYTAAIEEYVRRHPEHWFWVHNRWKRSPEPGEAVWQP